MRGDNCEASIVMCLLCILSVWWAHTGVSLFVLGEKETMEFVMASRECHRRVSPLSGLWHSQSFKQSSSNGYSSSRHQPPRLDVMPKVGGACDIGFNTSTSTQPTINQYPSLSIITSHHINLPDNDSPPTINQDPSLIRMAIRGPCTPRGGRYDQSLDSWTQLSGELTADPRLCVDGAWSTWNDWEAAPVGDMGKYQLVINHD